MKLNDVLLGLVKLRPGVSGYELRKIISQSTQYFMNAQLSQIYPALKQMAEEGLIAFEEEMTEGGRATKRYRLTEAGEAQFLACLREPMAYTLSMNSVRQCMLKMTFIGFLPREEQVLFLRDALDYFRYERDELMSGHIAVEEAYLDPTIAATTDLMRFWTWEIEHILESEGRLIAWLESMLIELERKG